MSLMRPSPFLERTHRWIFEGDHAFIFESDYPVVPKHALAIPKREIEVFHELNAQEWEEIHSLTKTYLESIEAVAFNFGLNGGKPAGQTVAHIHFHIFPFFKDTPPIAKGGYCNIFDNVPDYYKK